MRRVILSLLCVGLLYNCGCASSYGHRLKKISDTATKDSVTYEEKILALRRFVHKSMKAPAIGAVKKDGKVITFDEYYHFRDKKRFQMNTIEKLDYGYGWCDDLASMFMYLAHKQGIVTRMVYLHARPPRTEEHTIAEALTADGRWVIVDLDPSYNLELFVKNGKIATRSDIAKNPNILRNNDTIKKLASKNPTLWNDENYTSIFYNDHEKILSYERASTLYR